MKQNSHQVIDQQFNNNYYNESFQIETCSKMKEDVRIVITNNYNIYHSVLFLSGLHPRRKYQYETE